MAYLSNAPKVLIKLHMRQSEATKKRSNDNFNGGSRYQVILGRLLKNKDMERAWQEIGKRVPTASMLKRRQRGKTEKIRSANFTTSFEKESADLQAPDIIKRSYENLWSAMQYALVRSGTMRLLWKLDHPEKPSPPDTFQTRNKLRKSFFDIQRAAKNLIGKIELCQLDLLIYEFFPVHFSHSLFKTAKWSTFDHAKRYAVAHRRLPTTWPSVIEVLEHVALRAEKKAAAAIATRRIVDRNTSDRELNYFIRYMTDYFRNVFDGPMNGTLSSIASVILNRQITEETVRRALRHHPK